MIVKKQCLLALLCTSSFVYAMDTNKNELEQSDFMFENEKKIHQRFASLLAIKETQILSSGVRETQGADLQHGGKYIALMKSDQHRFGRGSSGKDAKL